MNWVFRLLLKFKFSIILIVAIIFIVLWTKVPDEKLEKFGVKNEHQQSK